MNPSLGTMEIYKNKTWNKLCTSNWNEDENILTCKAMGYFENSFYDNAWYNDHNASNATSCSSLTNCINTNKDKLQLCKGICHIKITNCTKYFLLSNRMSVKPETKHTCACANKKHTQLRACELIQR